MGYVSGAGSEIVARITALGLCAGFRRSWIVRRCSGGWKCCLATAKRTRFVTTSLYPQITQIFTDYFFFICGNLRNLRI